MSLTQSVASITNKISIIEQSVDGLAVRFAALVAGAASVSSGSGSARSWNVLDTVTAPQPLGPSGPMARDHLMTIEKRDTFSSPEDEHARSAVLLRFPCEQWGFRINWLNNHCESPTYQPVTSLSEFIAKQVACQPGLYSKQEPSVRTLWPDVEMMVSLHDCNAKTNIAVVKGFGRKARSSLP